MLSQSTRSARQRFLSALVKAIKEPWTGPVERRDPATYWRPSVHLTWMCRACRTWTMYGAYKVGRCNWCDEPRPTPTARRSF